MNESHKSLRRRWCDPDFPWRDIFSNADRGLDIGSDCDDKVPFDNFECFNLSHGDANKLSTAFDAESFDVLHGSHILQLMDDPEVALRDWFTLLKPEGYMILTVPDLGAYDRFVWPSKHNLAHKSSWSMWYPGSPAPIHVHVPTFLEKFADIAEVLRAEYVEKNYDWKKDQAIDQTFAEEDGAEIWIEIVLRKK